MAIILSSAADLVSVWVVYHPPAAASSAADLAAVATGVGVPMEFAVTLRGSMFVRAVNEAMRQNTLALQGIDDADNQAAGIAITAAQAKQAASETDPWRRHASSPEQRLLDNCIVGWRDVQDENGNQLGFDQSRLRELLELVGMDAAVYAACTSAVRQLNEKNSRPSPPPPSDAPPLNPPTQ